MNAEMKRPEVGQKVWIVPDSWCTAAVLCEVLESADDGWVKTRLRRTGEIFTLSPEDRWWPEDQEHDARQEEFMHLEAEVRGLTATRDRVGYRLREQEVGMSDEEVLAWIARAPRDHLEYVQRTEWHPFTRTTARATALAARLLALKEAAKAKITKGHTA
jgi:hypothetical protein